MDVDLPRGSELRQLPGAASRPADGEVSHILGPLFAEAEGAQLVARPERAVEEDAVGAVEDLAHRLRQGAHAGHVREDAPGPLVDDPEADVVFLIDRKSTRLNSSHSQISYAVFCLKKKNNSPRPRSGATPLRGSRRRRSGRPR